MGVGRIFYGMLNNVIEPILVTQRYLSGSGRQRGCRNQVNGVKREGNGSLVSVSAHEPNRSLRMGREKNVTEPINGAFLCDDTRISLDADEGDGLTVTKCFKTTAEGFNMSLSRISPIGAEVEATRAVESTV